MLAMHRLLLYALAAMNGGPFSTDPVVQEDYISPLPDALRRSLMAVHSTRRSKHSASPWRPEMDAFVLLRHVRDKIVFTAAHNNGRCTRVERTRAAARPASRARRALLPPRAERAARLKFG